MDPVAATVLAAAVTGLSTLAGVALALFFEGRREARRKAREEQDQIRQRELDATTGILEATAAIRLLYGRRGQQMPVIQAGRR